METIMSKEPETPPSGATLTNEQFARMAREALDIVADDRARIMKAIEKTASLPPPLDTAEKLHERLTRAFAALHWIARLECQTDPEEAADQVARRGYRTPCKDESCAPCIAFRALIKEGQLPF